MTSKTWITRWADKEKYAAFCERQRERAAQNWLDPTYARRVTQGMSAAWKTDKAGRRTTLFHEVTCPHCGKVGARLVMARWHGDNCKDKPND